MTTPAPAPTPTGDDVFTQPQPAATVPTPEPAPPAPAPAPVADPAPAPVDPTPAPVDPPKPGTELSPLNDAGELRVMGDVFDVGQVELWGDEAAQHVIEFKGDRLGIVQPATKALAGYSLSMTKFVPAQLRNDVNSLFIVEHLSPASYERVMYRLISAHEPDYTEDTLGELMEAIVEKTVDELKAKEAAEKAAKAGK